MRRRAELRGVARGDGASAALPREAAVGSPVAPEVLPLRQPEPAVFTGSPTRSRVVCGAVAVALLTLAGWASLVVIGLRPTPVTSAAQRFPTSALHQRQHP